MSADDADLGAARVAAAIGEPARARMLYDLMDGRARTSTELAIAADVTPSTASVHLQRLAALRLVTVLAQGRHRYYRLAGAQVAGALEALNVVAGRRRRVLSPATPHHLREARTCYDHLAGRAGVALTDRFHALRWLSGPGPGRTDYSLTSAGAAGLAAHGIDIDASRATRRRFAYACVDWSERRPHLGGALGAAVLALLLRRKWAVPDLDSRALRITPAGRRELGARFGVDLT